MDTRRQFVMAGLVMTAVLVLTVGMYVAFYPDDGGGRTRAEQVDAARTQTPDIITKPEAGRAPESPGDPGGWNQLLLFGVLGGGMGLIGTLAWRSAKRGRAAQAGPAAVNP